MFKHQKDVQAFMYKFNQRYRNKPDIPTEDERKLACKLILSEALEFMSACGFVFKELDIQDPHNPKVNIVIDKDVAPNLVDMVDALGDIQYVNDWAANCIGVDLEPIANEIQRSNMTKLWATCALCNDNVYKDGHTWVHEHPENYPDLHNVVLGWRAVKDEYGKILKPPSYSPADIKKELRHQGVKL